LADRPLPTRKCDYCGGDFRYPDTAKKDAWGNFYTVPGGYYIPFTCPRCGGQFCDKHRLPENHNCTERQIRKCEYCGGEFHSQEKIKKDAKGNFHIDSRGNYLPFKCPLCGGLFCDTHRLPENHQCVGRIKQVSSSGQPASTEHDISQLKKDDMPVKDQPVEHEESQPKTGNRFNQREYDEALEKDRLVKYGGPRPKTKNRFSKGAYNSAVMRERFGSYLKLGVILALLVVGVYSVTSTTILSDLSSFVQTQRSTISTAVSSINNNTETTGRYRNYQLGLVKGPDGVIGNSHGDFVVLINNQNAKNPTYSQLLAFLRTDKTDTYPYQYVYTIQNSYTGDPEDYVNLTQVEGIIDSLVTQKTPCICSDFAEMLHNNAEMAGIRCAYVSIEVGGSGHALDAFNTTDRGVVFIDCTGMSSEPKPSSCDKIVDVLKIGSSYIPRSLFPEPGWSDYYENAGTVTSIFMTWDGRWRK